LSKTSTRRSKSTQETTVSASPIVYEDDPSFSPQKWKDLVGSADSKAAHIWGKNLTTHNYNKLVLVALFERLKMFRGNSYLVEEVLSAWISGGTSDCVASAIFEFC
jgi:hypothetical protein